VSRDGGRRPATEERRNFHAPTFSPDGLRIATDFNSSDGRDVWVLDVATGLVTRATFDRDGHDATWTPDGHSLTYTSVRGGVFTALRTRPGSAEAPDSLLASTQIQYTGIWLRDGSGLVTVATGLEPGSGTDIALVRNGGRGPIEPLVATRFEEQQPAVSRDDRWLAFVSNQSGRNEVYARPLRDGGDQIQVSLAGGIEPLWSPDGRELFFRSGAGGGSELVAARIRLEPSLAVVSRTTLFQVADIATATPHGNYDISPDGRTFVMVSFNPSSRIMVIQNLPALVRKLSAQGGGR
jgi:Tol biopolymer transport system component